MMALRLISICLLALALCRAEPSETGLISGNPAATNVEAGTGQLGEWIGLTPDTGLRIGGIFMSDINWLITGGKEPGQTTWNFLFITGATADLETLVDWPGAKLGAQFLLYKGADVNGQAGTVQGYNSLQSNNPLARAELYQFWYRQSLFEDVLTVRIGKSVPTIDFTNVLIPIPTEDGPFAVSSVSGLIYTPLFINPTTLGVMPGYYDSAWGVTLNLAPTNDLYVNWGIYDGSLASGFTTGDHAFPQFNGTYFMIAEIGGDWQLTNDGYLGRAGFGGWQQTGQLGPAGGVTEDGTHGVYGFLSQTIWQSSHSAENDGSGIIGFFQWGINDSKTLPINGFLGAGVTAFNLVPGRPDDTFGLGAAYSWLNPNSFQRDHELMLQTYYQAKVIDNLYVQPVLTYINEPGANPRYSDAWAFSFRATVLF
ncbi:MAG: carbohydrate porin [Puniceicoccales bacterium]